MVCCGECALCYSIDELTIAMERVYSASHCSMAHLIGGCSLGDIYCTVSAALVFCGRLCTEWK